MNYGKSDLEIAEDRLLDLVCPVYNLSRQEAQRLCIERREVGAEYRKAGMALFNSWEGTPAQITRAHRLYDARQLALLSPMSRR